MIAVGLGAILVLVLAVFLGLKPQFNKLASTSVEHANELVKLEEAKMKLERLDAIRQEAAQIEAARIVLARRLPEEAELSSLVVELQKIANSSGLDFNNVEVDDIIKMPGYAEIPFTVQVTGTFYSLIDYLYRLEKMPREVVIDKFSVQGDGYPTLSTNIEARVFTANNAEVKLPPPSGESTQTGAAAPVSTNP